MFQDSESWLHFYSLIRETMRYDARQDYQTALMFQSIKSDSYLNELEETLRGRPSVVVGAGPSIYSFQPRDGEVILSADGATNYLASRGIEPQVVVTDLDGILVFPRKAIYVVHAHGDNRHLWWKLYEMEKVVISVQTRPSGKAVLIGGFTDGDRAYVLAKRMGSPYVRTVGMDMESTTGTRFSKEWMTEGEELPRTKKAKLTFGSLVLSVFS